VGEGKEMQLAQDCGQWQALVLAVLNYWVLLPASAVIIQHKQHLILQGVAEKPDGFQIKIIQTKIILYLVLFNKMKYATKHFLHKLYFLKIISLR
jgi:hypothetical protein